jgi:hypothetical protein
MSDEIKQGIERVGIVVGIVAALTALFGAFAVLPHRVAATERRVDTMEVEMKSARELLVRIDENVKALKEARR